MARKSQPKTRSKPVSRKPSRRGHPLRTTLLAVLALAVVSGGLYTVWLDYRVTSEFEGKRWSVPARVFARPLELFAGRQLSPANFVVELRAAGYQAAGQASRAGYFTREGARFRLRTRAFDYPDGREPGRFLEVRFDGDRIGAVVDADTGAELSLVRVDPAHVGNIYPAHKEDRILVRLDQVPRRLVEALVAVEDHEFLQHHGISFAGIARALIANIQAGRVVQGGSTLTQQLVKNFFLSNDRTLWRKANEAVMALLLEWHYDKREILQAYLNEVYLAQDRDRAVHGFGLASQHYFGEALSALTLSEQALLVGLVKGPSYYDPRRHPERARQRRDLVLEVMAQRGYVSDAAAARAQRQALGVVPQSQGGDTAFPGFIDLVKRHLHRDYRQEDLTSEGLRLFTTLAPHVQHAAETALVNRAETWSPDTQGAVVAVNVDDGEVQALVGGRDPRFAGFNRALDARRPIGSLIKPAVFLTALARPNRYGLGTLLKDEPITLQDAQGNVWTPRNYDGERHGEVPLWQALAYSYNVPSVRLGLDVGLRAVADTVERLGGEVPDTVYPSMLLGAVSETPLEVARMYQTLASGGFRTPLRSVRAVMTADGEVLSRYPVSVHRAFDPQPVYLLNHALQRVVRQGTARGLSRWVAPHLALGGKTGTTDDTRDSWFVGFSGDTLGVVWVGRDDNGRTGLTGSSGAMTVWGELFSQLQVRPVRLTPPEGVEPLWVDPGTGLLAASYCEQAVRLPYVQEAAPSEQADCVRRKRSVAKRAADWIRGLFGR